VSWWKWTFDVKLESLNSVFFTLLKREEKYNHLCKLPLEELIPLYPKTIWDAAHIVIDLPPTQVSVERLFSALKTVKSVLRASNEKRHCRCYTIPQNTQSSFSAVVVQFQSQSLWSWTVAFFVTVIHVKLCHSTTTFLYKKIYVDWFLNLASLLYLPYLFEYNAQNFVRNFNQKLRVRVIHKFFHQHALFYFFFWTLI